MTISPSKIQRVTEVVNAPGLLFLLKMKTSNARKNKRIPNMLGNFVNVAIAKISKARKKRLDRLTPAVRARSPTDTAVAATESEPPVDGADQSKRLIATTAQTVMSKVIDNLVFRIRVEVRRIRDAARAAQYTNGITRVSVVKTLGVPPSWLRRPPHPCDSQWYLRQSCSPHIAKTPDSV